MTALSCQSVLQLSGEPIEEVAQRDLETEKETSCCALIVVQFASCNNTRTLRDDQ